MYECMYVRYERVCHTISGLKMLHPEDPPPPHLLEAQKTCGGGYISCGQVKYFSEISCLTPPPKYSRVKGGGYMYACVYACMHGWMSVCLCDIDSLYLTYILEILDECL